MSEACLQLSHPKEPVGLAHGAPADLYAEIPSCVGVTEEGDPLVRLWRTRRAQPNAMRLRAIHVETAGVGEAIQHVEAGAETGPISQKQSRVVHETGKRPVVVLVAVGEVEAEGFCLILEKLRQRLHDEQEQEGSQGATLPYAASNRERLADFPVRRDLAVVPRCS